VSNQSNFVRFRVYGRVDRRIAQFNLRRMSVRDSDGFGYAARKSEDHVRARKFVRAWAKQNGRRLLSVRPVRLGAEKTVFCMDKADFALLLEGTPTLKPAGGRELTIIYDLKEAQ
jgi:hypothetical protein